MMRRLYRQIYLTIIVSLVLVVIVAGAVWRFGDSGRFTAESLGVAAGVIAAALPPPDAPAAVQAAAVDRLSARLRTEIALFDAGRRRIAGGGPHLPPPRRRDGWVPGPAGGAFSFALPDGRFLVLRPRFSGDIHPTGRLVLFVAAVALVVGLAAYPVVRRLTRRLERLQAGVETLGAGNLSARVTIDGRDEVAQLAASFNRAAERIEALVAAHRLLLANASHELRTPLSRIRLGVEFLKDKADPARKRDLERDIEELDALIEEILLSSRLDALQRLDTIEDVDLLALAAEECARYEAATLDGAMASVRGDPRLLRRLIRNLLDNAVRHGAPPVSVTVRRDGDFAVLSVADGGEAMAAEDRERIFDPFHRLKGSLKSTGAGLGLSLVRQIATLHRGTAEAGVTPAGKTCFQVRLPAV